MIEILQFLFATEKDQFLYRNQDSLVKELVNDYNFPEEDVALALAWFAPIADEQNNLVVNPDAIRSLSNWEEQHLPRSIVEQILEWEQTKAINIVEREILLDRIGELCLDWHLASDEAEELLDGLIYHIQTYKQNTIKFDIPDGPYLWADNYTVH